MSADGPSAVQGMSSAKLDALVEMMFLAASADGDFSDVERAHFLQSVESLTDGRLAGPELRALLDRAKTDLETGGREARLQAVKERLQDAGARKVALSLAIEVCAADGVLRTSERDLILQTAEALEIGREVAADLVAQVSRR
jgi:tellurite resistance protein